MAGKLDASDIGTGAGGLIMGALASGLFNRPTGVGMTKHIGETLFKHRNEITAPLFAFLTPEDEAQFATLELLMKDKHGDLPYTDILSQLLERMGMPASSRFRSIVLRVKNPTKSDTRKVTVENGSTDETISQKPVDFTETDQRVHYLREVVKDVIRFSGVAVDASPPDFSLGIEVVLKNLKIRNIADADSASAKLSRWWNDPSGGVLENVEKKLREHLELEPDEEITFDILLAKLTEDTPPEQLEKVPMGPLQWLFNSLLMGAKDESQLVLVPPWITSLFKSIRGMFTKRKIRSR